jgi:hypothetical protein
MGIFESLVTVVFFSIGAAVSCGSFLLVQRMARPVRWLIVPILLYNALVTGAWSGWLSDFDSARFEALKYHLANAYAIQQMSDRGRYLSCQDKRIDLAEDAKAACALALNPGPGKRIPGTEHRCGPLKMFCCFLSEPDNQKPERR